MKRCKIFLKIHASIDVNERNIRYVVEDRIQWLFDFYSDFELYESYYEHRDRCFYYFFYAKLIEEKSSLEEERIMFQINEVLNCNTHVT